MHTVKFRVRSFSAAHILHAPLYHTTNTCICAHPQTPRTYTSSPYMVAPCDSTCAVARHSLPHRVCIRVCSVSIGHAEQWGCLMAHCKDMYKCLCRFTRRLMYICALGQLHAQLHAEPRTYLCVHARTAAHTTTCTAVCTGACTASSAGACGNTCTRASTTTGTHASTATCTDLNAGACRCVYSCRHQYIYQCLRSCGRHRYMQCSMH